MHSPIKVKVISEMKCYCIRVSKLESNKLVVEVITAKKNVILEIHASIYMQVNTLKTY